MSDIKKKIKKYMMGFLFLVGQIRSFNIQLELDI